MSPTTFIAEFGLGAIKFNASYSMYEAIWWGNCFLSKCSSLIGGSFVLSNLIFWRLPTCLLDQKSHTTKACYLWFFKKKINCDVLTMDLSDHEEHKSKAPFEKILGGKKYDNRGQLRLERGPDGYHLRFEWDYIEEDSNTYTQKSRKYYSQSALF